MTHKTKGIVLRTVKYGETSVVATVYTELFGLQSYMVKGVRQRTKTSAGKSMYFQAGAILDMEVYHNTLKNLNFIKEYNWAYLYTNLFADVVKNTVAVYMIELLQHSLKQPEANPELFYLAHDTLKQLDESNAAMTANLPLYFSLHLAAELGFKIQGLHSADSAVLDLQEGCFVKEIPQHTFYATGELSAVSSALLSVHFYNELGMLHISRSTRQELLLLYQNYIALHVQDFGEIKTLPVLQQLFA